MKNSLKAILRQGARFCILFTLMFLPACVLNLSEGTAGFGAKKSSEKKIRIVTWNLQTFFDAKTVGSEFAEFKGSKTPWNNERYAARLDGLCKFMEETAADVYVFQEIENSGILLDIGNRLAGKMAAGRGWAHTCFGGTSGDVFGTAVISRFPLEACCVHQLDVRTARSKDGQPSAQPHLRPMLEVRVCLPDQKITIYACHWKSKLGGAAETEVWRCEQEKLLADCITFCSTPLFLVCGDFNRNINEFRLAEKNLATDNSSKLLLQGSFQSVALVSAWLAFSQPNHPGSYYYQNSWEKIDHFFYTPSLQVADFRTENTGAHTHEDGRPYAYSVFSGTGYSDHLPLICTISF